MSVKNAIIYVFFILITATSVSKAENSYFKISYGISNNDTGITAPIESRGSFSVDENDNGMMISAGNMIGGFWGVDFTYYNLGNSSVKVESGTWITSDKNSFVAQKAGTITNDISGFGMGLILGSNNDLSKSFGFDYYIKAGAHNWDKSGSIDVGLLDNNEGFKDNFYNKGIGGYGGLGISMGIYNGIIFDFAYDLIGISNDVSFNNNSSLLSGGIKIKF